MCDVMIPFQQLYSVDFQRNGNCATEKQDEKCHSLTETSKDVMRSESHCGKSMKPKLLGSK